MSKRSSRLITRAENETINTVVVKAINDEDVVKVIVGTNLTSVPVLSTQKLTTKRGRPRKKLTEDEVKSEGVEEDSDNESKSSETCEKPSGLCDDDDLDGGEMCSFRTPKKRQGMLYKAEESASKIRTGTGTPKTKPSTPSHKTPIKALTPNLRMTPRRNTSFRSQTPSTKHTPKKSTGTPRRTQGKVDIVVPKTPYQLRVRQKKAIQAYTRQMEDFDDGDSDFQGSDCSTSESEDSEQESNKEEESDKEEEESDSDSGKGSEDAIPSCRRSLRFQPPPATPSCKKRGKEFNYVFTADEYFRSQSDKCVTSDHNLSRLKSSHTHLPALSLPILCPSHQHALASRRAGDMHMFQRWMFALSQGFSILAYGLGSKYKILQKFHKEMLSNSHVVVVNGFFPSINIKEMEAMLRFLKTDLSQENKSSTAMQNSQSLKKIKCTDRKTNVYSVSLQAAKYAQVYQKEVTGTPESILFMTPTTTSAEETDSETHIPTMAETPVITAAEKTMNITTNRSKTSPTTAAEKRMSTVAETNLNCSSPFQSSQVSLSGEKKPPHTSTKLKDGETYQDFFNKNIDKARKLRNEILTASKQAITPVTKPVHQTPNRTTTKLTKKPFLALRQWKEYRYKTRKFHNSDHRRKYNGKIVKAI
ncbi:Origin recognition complex subunit 2 [Homalodisca vitripennis]|nr:Origin recognition complex subunit 2 [Homalodisca vitripennis]